MMVEDSAAPHPDQLLAFVKQARAYTGYAFGARQPTLVFMVRARPCPEAMLEKSDLALSALLATPVKPWSSDDESAAIERLIYWTKALLEAKGHPVLVEPQILATSNHSDNVRKIIFPCFHPKATASALGFVVSTMNRLVSPSTMDHQHIAQALSEELEKLGKSLTQSGAQGFNTIHFLRAASELGIPWHRLVGNMIQFGHGVHSKWLDSSLTDRSPSLSVQIARNKKGTATMLRMAGVPVPHHFLAENEEMAVQHAATLGYPVVVKPADLDGGQGVAAHLMTPASVRKAFSAARAASENVLVEKHVPGRDYRLQVVLGEVQGVLERVPGGVVGNGTDSVRTLIDRQNAERRTATDDRRYLHALTPDDEADALLATYAMSMDSIPADGQVIRLRGAANVASGGVPVPVPLEQVHADNLALACRAAHALRLDVAGIDLLIPDIEISWHESGAFVCEVNAQPQMFTTMHKPMLQKFIKGQGRIPVVVVIDGQLRPPLVAHVHSGLLAAGFRAGLMDADGVRIADTIVSKRMTDAFQGGRLLLQDQTVEAVIVHASDNSVLQNGWPFDRCTVLVLGQEPIDPSTSAAESFTKLVSSARGLMPRKIVVDARSGASVALAKALFSQHPNLVVLGATDTGGPSTDRLVADAVISAVTRSLGATTKGDASSLQNSPAP